MSNTHLWHYVLQRGLLLYVSSSVVDVGIPIPICFSSLSIFDQRPLLRYSLDTPTFVLTLKDVINRVVRDDIYCNISRLLGPRGLLC
jgi:hypothetical protein